MKRFLLATCLFLLFLSCSKDDDFDDTLLVVYDQTYCADPWGYSDNDNDLAVKIGTFFASTTIEIYKIQFDSKGTQQVCNACVCLSGKRIIVAIDSADLNTIETYGFQEISR